MYRLSIILAVAFLFSGIHANGDPSSEEDVRPAHPVGALNPSSGDWTKRGKKYSFYCGANVDFFMAWRNCADYNQELATIESLSDNEAFGAALNGYGGFAYTSGTDLGKEGSFVWLVNKRSIPNWNRYEAWESGEPDNNQGNNNCLVAQIKKGGRVQWNDVPCENKYCFMCQEILT